MPKGRGGKEKGVRFRGVKGRKKIVHVIILPCSCLSLVFEDSSPGAKVQVVLQTGYVGYHGNSMGDPGDGEHMAALGTLSLAPEVSWVTMDTKISDIFMVGCTHTHTHRMHTHVHTHTRAHTHTCTHTCTLMHTMHTHTHICTRTHT